MNSTFDPVDVRDYDQLVFAIRARMQSLGATNQSVDETAGLQSGYIGKILGPAQVKKFGAVSLGPTLGALGLKLVVTTDEDANPKYLEKVSTRARAAPIPSRLSMAAQTRMVLGLSKDIVIKNLMSELGKKGASKGGTLRMMGLSKEKRRRLAQKAAAARWKKAKKN